MNVALPDIDPPVRIRFGHRLTDDELLRFCAESDPFRVERDKNGELIVMTPTVFESGGVEGDVFGELRTWAMQTWIANGAELAWMVDPSRKAVEIYRPGREAEVMEGASAVEG